MNWRTWASGLLVPPFIVLVYFSLAGTSPDLPAPVAEPVTPVVEPPPDFVVQEEVLAPQSTLRDVLFRYGFDPVSLHQLVEAVKPVYNLNRVRAGNRLALEISNQGVFRAFRYDISDEEYLEVRTSGESYEASRVKHVFDLEVDEFSGVLKDSLWNAVLELGESQYLVAAMAELLQWDLDFTSLQSGDWFKVVVEKKFLDGDFVKYGRILAIQFRSGGRDIMGFLFEDPVTGEPKYYDEKGNALRKAFLKVPFQFSPRISSGFSSSRFHPILKKRRPHPAIDFAAPAGTPVLASASGSVAHAGVQGGFGKLVKIRHPNGFTTSYAHLSKILVKSGQKVAQGQVIGKVGSTGLATAAHLDYRVQDSAGRFLNPRNKISWPSDKPIAEEYRESFGLVRERFSARLAAIPEPRLKDLAAAD